MPWRADNGEGCRLKTRNVKRSKDLARLTPSPGTSFQKGIAW